ncbi:hypothetical protein EIP86_001960 [Pleurotus ostreatoroseus]|nr:hypothetical protein EIP86_001960 [Pleurotus ostreatoroseus]
MSQTDNLYIHAYHPDRHSPITPLGFLRMPQLSPNRVPKTWPKSTLIDLREECVKRGYMDQGDEFLVSSKSNKMLYPIAIIDEETFNVADYLAQTGGDNVYVRRKDVVEGRTFEEARSFADKSRSLSSSVTLDLDDK